MSKIGKQPVAVPSGVKVTVADGKVSVKGPKGELHFSLPPAVRATVADNRVVLTAAADDSTASSLQGMARSIVANMLTGVTAGYVRELELQGVGYRAAVQGPRLTLSVGFSTPVVFTAPAGISLQVKENFISVSGADKQLVGDVAAHIRSLCPPEPYKGKGIRYRGEYVRRKAGKTVA